MDGVIYSDEYDESASVQVDLRSAKAPFNPAWWRGTCEFPTGHAFPTNIVPLKCLLRLSDGRYGPVTIFKVETIPDGKERAHFDGFEAGED